MRPKYMVVRIDQLTSKWAAEPCFYEELPSIRKVSTDFDITYAEVKEYYIVELGRVGVLTPPSDELQIGWSK